MEEVGWNRILDLSNSQKQNEVDAVLASATFARSDQLRSFLRYVCQMEMDGRAEELNEYLVGIEALGRPASYTPSDDSSVRSRAWELRQKLLKLYSSERPHSEIRIELPKGGYVPHYLVRDAALDKQADHALEPLASQVASNLAQWERKSILPYLLVAVLSALAGALGVIGFNHVRGDSPAENVDPVIREAWGPLLNPGSQDLVVMSNALYFLIRPEYSGGGPLNQQFPVPEQVYSNYRARRPLATGTRLTMITSNNAVLMGYISGLVNVTGLLRQAKIPFDLEPERIVPTAELRKRNVILFGAPQDSITISELLSSGQFHFGYSSLRDIVIQKGSDPLDQAPYYFQGNRLPDRHETYITFGLITVVPSFDAGPQGTRTIVFSGITSVGAHAAAEFFSSPAQMQELRNHFRKQGLPGFPPAYQVVVRCKASDTLLISFEYADSAVISGK